jgi:cytochrome o ubiquinol oxidase subunit II
MKRIHFIIGILAFVGVAIAVYFVLSSDKALLMHPKGLIARSELSLIKTNIIHMLIVIVPTFILLFVTIWKYRAKNTKAKYDPDHTHGALGQLVLWVVPSIVIASMAVVTWKATHELDPYKPIDSEVEPLTIQVVALDWKWLFIYPEQGIATVNFVQFPAQTPIHLELSADGSPMNSFWLPELSGQIYSMTGMTTQLHLMADEPGVYGGRAAEINGKGLADMTFVAKSTSQSDFENWVAEVRGSPKQLTDQVYHELVQPSQNHPVEIYSSVENDLFNTILMKYMETH